jgi:serine protease inhibitor
VVVVVHTNANPEAMMTQLQRLVRPHVKWSSICTMFLLGAALAACNDSTAPKSGSQPPALISLPRALTVGETKVRDASNAFSFALLSKVNAAQPDDNIFLSPLSASFALGMTMNGASNQTNAEMRSALQFGSLSQSDINANYQSLIALLLSLDPTTKLTIANSIWYLNGFPFRQSFFDTTAKYFGATVKPLNFADAPASLAAINGWAAAATNQKIPTVMNTIDPAAVMFLLNAIYFKGTWRDQFEPARTIASTFTPQTGAAQPAQLMYRSGQISFTQTSTYQAVDLPYGNNAFSMTIVLPKTGTDVNSVAESLTPAGWQNFAATFQPQLVNLWLPKLKLTYALTLNDDLKSLGMQQAFTPGAADFTAMSPNGRDLFISFVKQNTFVDINEEGTEAAAVTNVGVSNVSAPVATAVRVDHPYLLIIRERLSGTILFIGKIMNMPS